MRYTVAVRFPDQPEGLTARLTVNADCPRQAATLGLRFNGNAAIRVTVSEPIGVSDRFNATVDGIPVTVAVTLTR